MGRGYDVNRDSGFIKVKTVANIFEFFYLFSSPRLFSLRSHGLTGVAVPGDVETPNFSAASLGFENSTPSRNQSISEM